MSCLELCCQCCCCKSEDPTSKYPHIEYKSLGDATRAVPVQKTDFQTTPLQNIFGSSQNHAEYTVHHEVTESAITAQPTSMNEDSPVRRPKKRFTTQVTYPNLLLPGQSPKSPAKRISLPSGPSPLADGIESSFIRQSPTKHRLLPFEFPIIEQTEVFPEEAGTYSTLQFSIFYDVQQSRLQIHLLKAIKLKLPHGPQSSPRRRQPSVLVVMHLYPHGEDIFSSQPMPWSPSTDFNQLFEFKGLAVDGARSQSLVFRIYKGTKPSQANFVGSVVLPLGEADLFGVITTMRIDETGANLPGDSKGDLLLSLMYNPAIHILKGTVMRITNLHKKHVVGLADPYVKVFLVHKGVRRVKWKSSIKRNTLKPVFNESFEFDVSPVDVKDVSLEVMVMDYDHFTRNHPIGVVLFGMTESVESGISHWEKVFSSPYVSISHWHSILPDYQSSRKRAYTH